MADAMDVRRLLKNTKIEVQVVEDLEDLLVVSFDYEERPGGSTKYFQGVLLNSKKKNWPLGLMAAPPGIGPFPPDDSTAVAASVESLQKCEGGDAPAATSMALDSDRLYAVRRRHTYIQNGGGVGAASIVNATVTVGPTVVGHSMEMAGARRSTYCRRFGDRAARTMRLRPRQVLCSKCKSICNENSENVQVANAVKARTGVVSGGGPPDVSVLVQSSRAGPIGTQPTIGSCGQTTTTKTGGRMVLRKRRIQNEPVGAVGDPPPLSILMEQQQPSKILDEPIPPEADPIEAMPRTIENAVAAPETLKHKKTSPFIKISFGPQGTVIKIPPRTHTYIASDNESDLQEVTPESGGSSSSPAYRHFRAKAAKKALKKAKKDAQKLSKQVGGTGSFGAAVASAGSPMRHDPRKSRHHKHKFKHKRRRREDDDEEDVDGGGSGSNRDESSSSVADQEHSRDDASLERRRLVVDVGRLIAAPPPPPSEDEPTTNENGTTTAGFVMSGDRWDQLDSNPEHGAADAYSKIKKECLRQKLSISLKRLSEKSYMKCSPTYNNNNNNHRDDSNGNGGSSGNGIGSNESSEAGDLPEFPESEPPMRPLMMRISSYNVTSFSVGDGRVISIGDVVWGKIHGFPWWPGKVLSISVSQRDNGMLVTQQAHVAWFGSSTSSQMPCNQLVPFLEDFKLRYNKKKRGPYKEAIKQATLAAQQVLRSVGIDT